MADASESSGGFTQPAAEQHVRQGDIVALKEEANQHRAPPIWQRPEAWPWRATRGFDCSRRAHVNWLKAEEHAWPWQAIRYLNCRPRARVNWLKAEEHV